MESILLELGYPQGVVDRFNGEGVTPEAVGSLTMNQLDDLGIHGMGRQAILRGRCRSFLLNSRLSNLSRNAEAGPSRQALSMTRQLFSPYGSCKRKKKVHKFGLNMLCLSQRSITHVPSTLAQRVLLESGLGEKRVSIPADANAQEFMELVIKAFPKLRDAGGFEYLKAEGSSKILNELTLPPNGGFNAENMRSIVKHSRLYIRPIQTDLVLTSNQSEVNSDEHDLFLECNHCKEKFAQTKLRQHVSLCQNQEDGEEPDHDIWTTDCLTPSPPLSPLTSAGSTQISSTNRSRSTVGINSSAEPSTVMGEREEAGIIHQPSTSSLATATPTPPDQSTRYSEPPNSASFDVTHPVPALPQLPPETDSTNEVMHTSVEDIVKCLESAVNDDLPANVINISRYNLLRQAHKAFKKDSFKDTARLSIRFSGEDGIDNGGLSREFMSIAMQELADQSIFCGENGKDLALDFAAINNRTYFTTGRMLAYFIVHRGPAPCLMSKHLYQLIVDTTGLVEKVTVNDVRDPEVKENIMKIVQASETEYNDTISQLFDFIELAGCGNLAFDIRKRPLLVKYLVRFFTVDRLQPAVDQLKEGLRTLGMLEKMEKFPTLMSKLFTYYEEASITAQQVVDMFEVDWSENGFNRHRKETLTR